jgi:two-component system sensor kinase FixL
MIRGMSAQNDASSTAGPADGHAADRVRAWVWVCDRGGRVRFANRSFADRVAAKPVGRLLRDVLPDAEYRQLASCIERALRGEPAEVELPRSDAGGGGRVRVWLAPVGDGGYAGFGVDVGTSDDAGSRSRPSGDRGGIDAQIDQVRRVLDTVADAALRVDESGSIQGANPAAGSLFGVSPRELEGNHYSTLLPGFVDGPMRTLYERSRAAGGLDASPRHADGHAIPVHLTISDLGYAERKQYIIAVRDFTAIRAAQQRLLASERLAAIGETMTALAHDSRNALQRIQSCLTLLQLRSESSEVQELIDDMQDAQDQLQRLYDEVNNFAAPMPLQIEEAELCELLDQTWQELSLNWRKKQLAFSCEDSTGGVRARIDPVRMEQVFRNLLENAIDASLPGGSIRAAVGLERVDGRPVVRLTLEDDGAGMPSDVRDRVFDLLFSTKDGGTGMGMAIARRIVHEHGGDIELDSRPGNGTTVVVRLPHDDPVQAAI